MVVRGDKASLVSTPEPHPIRIALAGSGGRMGRSIVTALEQHSDLKLTAAIVRACTTGAHVPLGGVVVTDDIPAALSNADVLVDFSVAENATRLAEAAAERGLPYVVGTTGFTPAQETEISRAAELIPIVKSGNMSLGVALLADLVKRAAAVLPDFDVEVLDMHHRMKRDAPSGTALLLGQAAADGRKAPLRKLSEGGALRNEAGEIGFASLRGGTVVGEHSVIFAGPFERLVLSHTAEDRSIFARGALSAARWIVGKPAGLYGMQDVLGI